MRSMPSRLGLVVGAMLAVGAFTSGTAMAREGPGASLMLENDYDYVLRLSLFSPISDDIVLAPVGVCEGAGFGALPIVGSKFAVKDRASRSAVRPTAIAGWRSGRVRYLSAG